MPNQLQQAPQELGEPIAAGITEGQVWLAEYPGGLLIMTFLADAEHNPENRWTLEFARAVHVAFDAVEAWLAAHPPRESSIIGGRSSLREAICAANIPHDCSA